MSIPVRQKIIAGFLVGMSALSLLGFVSYLSINRQQESSRWVEHTLDVVSHIRQINSDLRKAQAGYWGYLASQNPYFLKSARAGLHFVIEDAYATRKMTEDNTQQLENFRKLIPLLQEAMDGIQYGILLCNQGHLDLARKRFQEKRVIDTTDGIEKVTNQMIVLEQYNLTQRTEMENAHIHITLGILLFGGFLSLSLMGMALVIVNREIGQKEKAQGMLQVNEYRLFQFLEAVPLGIFVLDREGKPFYANQKARELLGHGIIKSAGSDEMAVLNHAYVAGTDNPYPPEQLPMIRALKGEKSVIEDLEIHLADGRVIPLQIWGTPVFGMKEEIQYALAIFSDITERRHVEEMKQSLISVVSHQLKTPVGEINGYIENLLDGLAGELSPKQADYMMDMREIGMNNYRLISDLLNLSKIERGLTTATVEKMPLLEIIQLSMRDYENILARKGLTLTLEGLDGIPDVMADRDKMVETLRNLINNAIKFTDKGGLTFSVETKERVLLLKVKDTGRGISDASLAQLFTQKRVLGEEAGRAGAGLGLYVAKHFMKAQGGDISAVTQAGKGSCFTLTIPRAL